MKGTLFASVVLFIMAGWTLFSDIFEWFTHLPTVLPTWDSGIVFVIIWSDYIMFTLPTAFFGLVLAVHLFRKSRIPNIGRQTA